MSNLDRQDHRSDAAGGHVTVLTRRHVLGIGMQSVVASGVVLLPAPARIALGGLSSSLGHRLERVLALDASACAAAIAASGAAHRLAELQWDRSDRLYALAGLDDTALIARVGEQSRADFQRGATVSLGGWVISETEALVIGCVANARDA